MAINKLNLQERLGNFPKNSNDQQVYLATLLATLDTYLNAVKNLSGETIVLAQISEPTQAQWETEWLKTHATLPIPPSAILVWYDTNFNRVGKVYGTINGVAGILSREPNVSNGANLVLEATNLAGTLSTSNSIGNVAGLPSINFYLPRSASVILYATCYATITAGSGNYGIDFDLDGDKVGSTYDTVPSDYGIINYNANGTVSCEFKVDNVAAGNHTASVLFGVAGSPGSPPTVRYTDAGLLQKMYFGVRAVAL